VDRGMNRTSCSMLVILFRNCHCQSFQTLSGMSPKNLYPAAAMLPGGSPSRLAGIVRLPGGCSSASLSLQLSGQQSPDSHTGWRLSFADDVFTSIAFLRLKELILFMTDSCSALSLHVFVRYIRLFRPIIITLDRNLFPCYNLHVSFYMKQIS
jgi:hypothetical protein